MWGFVVFMLMVFILIIILAIITGTQRAYYMYQNPYSIPINMFGYNTRPRYSSNTNTKPILNDMVSQQYNLVKYGTKNLFDKLKTLIPKSGRGESNDTNNIADEFYKTIEEPNLLPGLGFNLEQPINTLIFAERDKFDKYLMNTKHKLQYDLWDFMMLFTSYPELFANITVDNKYIRKEIKRLLELANNIKDDETNKLHNIFREVHELYDALRYYNKMESNRNKIKELILKNIDAEYKEFNLKKQKIHAEYFPDVDVELFNKTWKVHKDELKQIYKNPLIKVPIINAEFVDDMDKLTFKLYDNHLIRAIVVKLARELGNKE